MSQKRKSIKEHSKKAEVSPHSPREDKSVEDEPVDVDVNVDEEMDQPKAPNKSTEDEEEGKGEEEAQEEQPDPNKEVPDDPDQNAGEPDPPSDKDEKGDNVEDVTNHKPVPRLHEQHALKKRSRAKSKLSATEDLTKKNPTFALRVEFLGYRLPPYECALDRHNHVRVKTNHKNGFEAIVSRIQSLPGVKRYGIRINDAYIRVEGKSQWVKTYLSTSSDALPMRFFEEQNKYVLRLRWKVEIEKLCVAKSFKIHCYFSSDGAEPRREDKFASITLPEDQQAQLVPISGSKVNAVEPASRATNDTQANVVPSAVPRYRATVASIVQSLPESLTLNALLYERKVDGTWKKYTHIEDDEDLPRFLFYSFESSPRVFKCDLCWQIAVPPPIPSSSLHEPHSFSMNPSKPRSTQSTPRTPAATSTLSSRSPPALQAISFSDNEEPFELPEDPHPKGRTNGFVQQVVNAWKNEASRYLVVDKYNIKPATIKGWIKILDINHQKGIILKPDDHWLPSRHGLNDDDRTKKTNRPTRKRNRSRGKELVQGSSPQEEEEEEEPEKEESEN